MKASHLFQKSLSLLGLIIFKTNHPAARYHKLSPNSGLTYALHRAFKNLQGIRFIQVGANDGVRCDPIFKLIHDFKWVGTLVEPRTVFMDSLKQRYTGNPGLRLVQCAVSEDSTSCSIFFIDPKIADLPDWTQGLATLDRNRINTACQDLGLPLTAVCEETVHCMTWEDLEPETSLDATDLLVIDIEGFDIPLLNLWNWEKRIPRVVHFEHGCSHPDVYFHFLRKMRSYGYEIVSEQSDTTLFLPQNVT